MAELYQTVGWDTLQFDRKGYSASWLHYSYSWLGYTKPLGGTPYSLIEKVIAQAGCITPILAGLYQTVGWDTLQFDRAQAGCIIVVAEQAGCITLLLFLAGLYQTVGWDTLQFDRKGYSASWLHYS